MTEASFRAGRLRQCLAEHRGSGALTMCVVRGRTFVNLPAEPIAGYALIAVPPRRVMNSRRSVCRERRW